MASAINEDQLTWSGKVSVIKRKAMVSLLQYLSNQGARVDGVGLQGHCEASLAKNPNPDVSEIVDVAGTKQFIQDLGRAGYEVHFSEMDYDANGYWGADTKRQDQSHAEVFAALLSECLLEKNVLRVGFWGLVDTDHHP